VQRGCQARNYCLLAGRLGAGSESEPSLDWPVAPPEGVCPEEPALAESRFAVVFGCGTPAPGPGDLFGSAGRSPQPVTAATPSAKARAVNNLSIAIRPPSGLLYGSKQRAIAQARRKKRPKCALPAPGGLLTCFAQRKNAGDPTMAEAKAPRRNPREATGRNAREGGARSTREATAKAGIKTTRAADLGASPPVGAGMTDDMRRQIEEAAYYRAQQRGFEPGYELDDWVAAESEVMRRKGARP
jgi:hypothetical protein